MAFSSLIDDIERTTGKFDLKKQYYVNNVSPEDIIVSWALNQPEERGSGTYTIRSGETGGPFPQFLAYHIVKKLVNREMQREGKIHLFSSAMHREPYEKKYLQEITEASLEQAAPSNVVSTPPVAVQSPTESPAQPKRGRPRKQQQEFEGVNRN